MPRLVPAIVTLLITTRAPAAPAPAQGCPQTPSDPECDATRFWRRPEYLLWRTKDLPAPTLRGARRIPGSARTPLLGGDDRETDEHHGGRLSVGGWLTGDHRFGIEGSYFLLPTTTARRVAR